MRYLLKIVAILYWVYNFSEGYAPRFRRSRDISKYRLYQSPTRFQFWYDKVLKKSLMAYTLAALHIVKVGADEPKAPESIESLSSIVEPEITDIVYLDIKIANYTEESIGTNRGAYGSGRIFLGLYGNDAPIFVKQFLKIVASDGEMFPSFLNSQFGQIVDQKVLQLDGIADLDVVTIAGNSEYEYRGSLLSDWRPFLETNALRHDKY